ncbi:HD domain-containing protein, partial [Halobium palmae]
LEDASELVGALRATERAGWRLGVYAPEEVVDDVREAAVDVLGVRASG